MKKESAFLKLAALVTSLSLGMLCGLAEDETGPKIHLDWGEAGTAEAEKLFLSWQTTPGKTYQVRRYHAEDVPQLPWPMPRSVIPWQDLGAPLYGMGSVYRLHVLTALPPGTEPPPGPELPPMVMLSVQPLANGTQVVFSWVGEAACRKVVTGMPGPGATLSGVYQAATRDVFAMGQLTPLAGDAASLETPLSAADETVWAELLPLVPNILNDEVTVESVDMGGQSAPIGESGQARMWRVEERWPDTDGDGIYDWQELAAPQPTNPFNNDSDGDGFTDKQEIDNGYDPTLAANSPDSNPGSIWLEAVQVETWDNATWYKRPAYINEPTTYTWVEDWGGVGSHYHSEPPATQPPVLPPPHGLASASSLDFGSSWRPYPFQAVENPSGGIWGDVLVFSSKAQRHPNAADAPPEATYGGRHEAARYAKLRLVSPYARLRTITRQVRVDRAFWNAELSISGLWQGTYQGYEGSDYVTLVLPAGQTVGTAQTVELPVTEGKARQAEAVLLPVVDLIIHKTGPDGPAIPETSETHADSLVLPVNDNFDERRRSNSALEIDYSDNRIDLTKDPDYLRLTLRIDPSRTSGTVSLKYRTSAGAEASPDFLGKIYTADGQQRITSEADFTVNLANPSGPLAAVNTPQGVTLLLESLLPMEDAVLVLKQEQNGILLAQDEVHLHIVDVDFLDTSGPGALDDDDESSEIPQRWAMMVPLSGGTTSNGSGEVKVKMEPATLASKVKISWATSAPPSVFESLTLSAGEHTLTIDGSAHAIDNALKVEWLPNQQVIDGLKVDFLARRPRDTAQKVKIALWRIKDTDSSQIPAAPYTQAEILAFLQQTWTAQANVQFEVVQDWQLEEVDYDLNDDGALSTQSANAEFVRITNNAVNANADMNLYVVQKLPHALATRASTGGVFIALENKDGQTTLLSQLAQEVGHELGLPEDYDDPEDAGNVMSDPQTPGSTQVRKKDWRKANDPEN